MKKVVELRPAWEWTCDVCGEDRFVRAVVVEMSPSEMQELRDEHGIQSWSAGDFMTIPDWVECPCGHSYQTKAFRDGDSLPEE